MARSEHDPARVAALSFVRPNGRRFHAPTRFPAGLRFLLMAQRGERFRQGYSGPFPGVDFKCPCRRTLSAIHCTVIAMRSLRSEMSLSVHLRA